MNKVEIFQDCKNNLGEGIIWSQDTNTLYWLDIPMPSKLYQYSFNNNKNQIFEMPEMITAMAERDSKNLLIASHYGINNFNTESNKFNQIISFRK